MKGHYSNFTVHVFLLLFSRNGSLSPAFQVSASRVDLKTPEPVAIKNISFKGLEKKLEPYLNDLKELGFFKLLHDLDRSEATKMSA